MCVDEWMVSLGMWARCAEGCAAPHSNIAALGPYITSTVKAPTGRDHWSTVVGRADFARIPLLLNYNSLPQFHHHLYHRSHTIIRFKRDRSIQSVHHLFHQEQTQPRSIRMFICPEEHIK